MVEGRDGDDKGRRMAEGGDNNGEGRRMAEGRDATARRDCGRDDVMVFILPKVNMSLLSPWGGSFFASQSQSQPSSTVGNHSIQGVTIYTPQGQSRLPFAMGSNYVEGHGRAIYISQSQPESQSQPPFAMGRTSVHHVMYPTYDGNNTPHSMPPHSMPLVYSIQTSFQELLKGTSVQQFAVQLSQASYSPADNHVDGHPWRACTER